MMGDISELPCDFSSDKVLTKTKQLAKDFPRTLFIILFLYSLSALLCGQQENDRFGQVDRLFSEWDKTNSPGCALAIVQDGRILYRRGYGLSNLEHEVTIKPYTAFMIGSTSKQFTAASILILQHQGLLALDDDIRKYIPEMPQYEWPIKIRHLIHHMSGIREYELLQTLGGELTDQGLHRNDDLLELIARQKGLDFKPGEKFQYSNSGYTLLAVIVERISGKSLGQFERENIFGPLGMARTFIFENNRSVIKDRATGYFRDKDGFKVDESLNESTGDGGVYTTIDDFFLWDQNFYHNQVGYSDLVRDLLQVGRLNDGTPPLLDYHGQRYKYAFGLLLSTYKGLNTISHGGSYVGFRTGYIQFPDQKFSVICLANIANIDPTDLCYAIADIFLKEHYTEKENKEPAEASSEKKVRTELPGLTGKQLEEYVGDYYNDELPVLYKLRNLGGKLVFVQKNAPSTKPLKLEKRDTFSYWELRLKFNRSKKGLVNGFSIESNELTGMMFKKKSPK